MKILHIIVGLNVGGAELMLKRLIEFGSVENSITHSVISLTDIGPIGSQLEKLGIQVTALNMGKFHQTPLIIYKLYRLIQSKQPDIVQTWMYHSDLLGGLAARIAGIRNIIWGIRTTDIKRGGNRTTLLIRKICAKLSRYIPTSIVCAADAARQVHIKIGYDANRMVVIPNGFDTSRLSATVQQRDWFRAMYGIEPHELAIGSVGRFSPVKDHAGFIAAASAIAPFHPDLKFVLVGRNVDNENAFLTERIKASGHMEKFILLGERDDIPICLSAMDIFCLHSSTEGFPNALGEAMAMGLPCVTTDVGDARFLLGTSGIVVDSCDQVALATGLRQLIQLPIAMRLELGKKAQQRINSQFTMPQTVKQFASLYKKICGESNA